MQSSRLELVPTPAQKALSEKEKLWAASLAPPTQRYAERLDGWNMIVAETIDREMQAGNLRLDSWQNALTGIGTSRDKVAYSQFFSDGQLDFSVLESLYHNDDMAARICDEVPAQCWREGFSLDLKDPAAAEELEEALEALGMADKFEEGEVWGRLYGGAKCLVGADDGESDPSKPLNETRIKSIDYLEVFDRYSLFPWKFYDDPKAAKYGTPEVYRIIQPITANLTGGLQFQVGSEVHESRLIHFGGARTSLRKRRANLGWDDSILQRVYQVLMGYGVQWASITHLLSDAGQGAYKIKGLLDMIVGNNKELLEERMRTIEMSKSVARGVLLDAESEEYTRVATPFGGIPELTDRLTQRLAAAAGMPVSVLMGEAPAGLNATGDSDIRNWYDKIAGLQKRSVGPKIKRLVQLLMLAKEGPTGGKVYDKFQVCFESLWQLTPVEEATRRKTIAETDQIYGPGGIGAVTAEEIAKSHFGERGYSPDIQIDLELRDELMAADKQAAQLAGGKTEEPQTDPNAPPAAPAAKEQPPKTPAA